MTVNLDRYIVVNRLTGEVLDSFGSWTAIEEDAATFGFGEAYAKTTELRNAVLRAYIWPTE